MKKLSEDRFLADLFTKDAVQANFLQRIIDGLNNVAKQAGVAVSGDLPAPPPVNDIRVKASGEMIHATLTHNAEVSRAIEYHIEADTNPSFTQPHVMSINSSRTHIFHLPTFNDAGVAQKWYLRAYPQYPGGKPAPPTVLGGTTNPTSITLQGTTKMTLLPSTGSGTASTTGQQGGAGRGRQRLSTPKAVRIGKQQASATQVAAPVVGPPIHLLASVGSASQQTSLAQVGTSTAITVNGNAGDGTFYVGDLIVQAYQGSVDPGSLGTWYVYHDDPNFQGGQVKYQVTSDVTVLGRGYGRFYNGKIVTTVAGGATGGGKGGGGGRQPIQ